MIVARTVVVLVLYMSTYSVIAAPKDADRISKLFHAASHGNRDAIESLIEQDVDLNVRNKAGETPVYIASGHGHADVVELLADNEADLNIPSNVSLFTPLHYAVHEDEERTVEVILNKKANINPRDSIERTPLHISVEMDHTNIARLLIERGAEVNAQNKYKETPLYLAVKQNQSGIVELLLKHGANANIPAADGITPFFLAVQSRNTHMFMLLFVGNGMDINGKDVKGNTAVHIATQMGSQEMVSALIENGANVILKNNDNESPLALALKTDNEKIAKLIMHDRNFKIERWERDTLACNARTANAQIKELLTGINVYTEDDWTIALYQAIRKNDADLVNKLIKSCVQNPEELKKVEETWPLHVAVQKGYIDIAEILIRNGADVNLKDQMERSALHWAASNGNANLVNILIDNDANISATDSNGFTALDLAVINGHEGIAKELIARGPIMNDTDTTREIMLHSNDDEARDGPCSVYSFHFTIHRDGFKNCLNEDEPTESPVTSTQAPPKTCPQCKCPQCECPQCNCPDNEYTAVRLLSKLNLKLNYQDDDGRTALHWAAEKGCDQVAILLVEKGAALNIQAKDGNTPLILAAQKSNENIVRMLIDKGAKLNIQNVWGDTPLIWAANKNHEKIAQMLLDKGADMNIQSTNGFTALNWATYMNHPNIVRMLIDRGADVNIRTTDGKTALDVANAAGRTKIAEMLRRV